MQYDLNNLSPNERDRYSQQLILESMGVAGQLKLKNARVLCVGAGGLGSAVSLYLVAAGIGTLGIMDPDTIERSNLHRQTLYFSHHVGQQKALVAGQQLLALNPTIQIQSYPSALTSDNANQIIAQYDMVVDCADKFSVTYLINDICVKLDKPFIFGSVEKFAGQCAFFLGKKAPCFRCAFPENITNAISSDCSRSGILNTLPGLVGMLQATEVIKFIVGLPTSLFRKLLTIDALTLEFKSFTMIKNPECYMCNASSDTLNPSTEQTSFAPIKAISLDELKRKVEQDTNTILLDVRSHEEHDAYHIGGIVIPLPELSDRLAELDLHKPIITYCKSGHRSRIAANILQKAGCENVSHLQEKLV